MYSWNSWKNFLLSKRIASMLGMTIKPTAISARDQMASMGMVTAMMGGTKKNHCRYLMAFSPNRYSVLVRYSTKNPR